MKKLPASRNCFVCGRKNPSSLKLTFFQDDEGKTSTMLHINAMHEGYPGVTHGGVIAAILDETSGRAISLDPNEFFVTSELKVRYRKPVPIETDLIAKGWLVKRRGRVAIAKGCIMTLQDDILAESEGAFVQIPAEAQDEMHKDMTDWRVYRDDE